MTCIIIEDEPPAAEKLANFISKLPYIHLLSTFNSAVEAIEYLKTNSVDLIFLDIEMKELTGVQFLESVDVKSKIVITSAYEKYAIKGFELQVADYLLKPVTFDRFLKACEKVYNELNRHQSNHQPTKIFIKTEYRLEGVDIDSILYVEGMGDYRKVVTAKQKIMTLQTFKELLHELPGDKFARVHNSYIVAINKIEKIERSRIQIGDKTIPISNANIEMFYKKIGR